MTAKKMATYDVFHRGALGNVLRVASKQAPMGSDPAKVIERCFQYTQNIHEGWTDLAAANGMALTQHSARGCRSTSVGDYVRVSTEAGVRWYLCEAMGWAHVAEATVPAVRS